MKSDRVRSNICLQLSSFDRADYYSSYIQKIIEKEGYVPLLTEDLRNRLSGEGSKGKEKLD